MMIAIDPFSLLQTVLNTVVTLPTTADSLVNLISKLYGKIMSFKHPSGHLYNYSYPQQYIQPEYTTFMQYPPLMDQQNSQASAVLPKSTQTTVPNNVNSNDNLVKMIMQFLTDYQYKNYQIFDETQPQNDHLYSKPYIFIPINFDQKPQ